MANKCLICDKEFTTKELLKNHEQQHLSESILNKSKENSQEVDVSFQNKNIGIDIKKIFSEEKFEKLIEFKMKNIFNVKEIIIRRNFVDQIKKINQKNPFCYPSYFVRDFIAGFTHNELQEKYHIWYWMDLYSIIHNILKFSENRYISQKYPNARELNLKILDWDKKYQEFQDNCKFFEKEINELFFDNVLQTEMLFLLMDNELGSEELSVLCKELKNHYNLFHFVDGDLADSFNKILEIDLEKKIEDILSGLKRENVIVRSRSDPTKFTVKFSIDEIKNNIINELKISGKMDYSTLRSSITNKFPGLRLIPKFGVFDAAWKELEKEEKIHIEYNSSRNHDFVIFLNDDYQKIDINIKSIEENQVKIPFRGRKITPERFVSELIELDRGDFNDPDDQVTRLAGLVLAESVKIQSAHEKIAEFDFTIDIKNYQFRPEQLEAIAKLDFKINAEILHVKVMIDEFLSFDKYVELKKKIPSNEQGVIITFKEIPIAVKRDIENNGIIQIIDEKGVLTWVSITPRIPARVNSISKIFYDPLSKIENKIVKINSVFYETGIALVSIFPEMNDETVLIRTLEEIEIPEVEPKNFHKFSENYLQFLEIIDQISDSKEQFEAFFKNNIKHVENSSKNRYNITFENHSVMLQLNHYQFNDVMSCTCLQWIENKSKLCTHLITSLDWVVRNSKFLDDSWNSEYNPMRNAIELFLEYNISKNLDNIIYEIDEKQESFVDDKTKTMLKNLDFNEKEMLLDFASKILKS